MHSLEPEIDTLVRAGSLDADGASRAAALESGRVFTMHRELLALLYTSVLAIVGGAGLLVRDNLDRIGPVALTTGLLVAAALCYAVAIRSRLRGETRSLAGDYVLLLGALLLSSAVGYAETQFHLLGDNWSRHLLLLAAFHAVIAYALDSRLVLSVALTGFAGWLGVEARLGALLEPRHAVLGAGYRALACAAVFLLARTLHDRFARARDFPSVYEHFAANLAFWGALALLSAPGSRWIGAALCAALAAYVGVRGLRRGQESFVLYAVGYGALGATVLLGVLLRSPLLVAFSGLATLLAAAALLSSLRARMKDVAQ